MAESQSKPKIRWDLVQKAHDRCKGKPTIRSEASKKALLEYVEQQRKEKAEFGSKKSKKQRAQKLIDATYTSMPESWHMKKISASAFIFVSAIGLMAICLFPPWEQTFSRPGMPEVAQAVGHHLIFLPPAPNGTFKFGHGIRVDTGRFLILVVAVLSIALVSAFSGAYFGNLVSRFRRP